jgi:regulator of sigma E protease
MSALLLIAILVGLVIVHECGHFIVAKLSGVRVEEFGIGYPPRAFSFGVWKGTEYTLNWLPFGGFVKLLEEDGMELSERTAKRAGSFAAAPRYTQALILVAGVAANVLAGWLLFSAGLMTGMPTAVDEKTDGAQLIVSGVLPGSPADLSGLAGGDTIESLTFGKESAELTPQGVSDFIAAHGGKELALTVTRDEQTRVILVRPAHAVNPESTERPAIGVQLSSIVYKQLGLTEALSEGWNVTVHALKEIWGGMVMLFTGAFAGTSQLSSLVGPVGLTQYVGDAASQGMGQFFGLAAFISLNLAIINLLPIPALDGGRLLFVGIESILRRRIHPTISQITNTVGFLLIIGLMIAVTVNDVSNLAQ